jgi:hypothetical protein
MFSDSSKNTMSLKLDSNNVRCWTAAVDHLDPVDVVKHDIRVLSSLSRSDYSFEVVGSILGRL